MITSSILVWIVLIFVANATGVLQYVVFPTDRHNVLYCSLTTYALWKLVGPSNFITYSSPTRGVTEFWLLLRPTAEQVTAISRQEHVSFLAGLGGCHVRTRLTYIAVGQECSA